MAPLNEPRPVADYNCAMAELYAGLKLVWKSQSEREAEFEAENTLYVPGLSVTRIAAVKAAQQLPDGQARTAEAEDLRVTLTEQHDVIIGKWNSLDGYIGKAFKGAHYKPRIEEAGKQYYDRAVNQNWEYVDELLVAGKNFLTNHGAALVADGGMPAGFVASYDAVKLAFDQKYVEFKDAQQDAQEQTDVKIKANNAIYKDGREMMEDGKHIFRKEASIRDRFVWERVLELVTPGAGGEGVVVEGDLVSAEIGNVDISVLEDKPISKVTVEAIDSNFRFYGSPMANAGPSIPSIDLIAGQSVVKTLEEFKAATGLGSGGNNFLNVQNSGLVAGQWRITFE